MVIDDYSGDGATNWLRMIKRIKEPGAGNAVANVLWVSPDGDNATAVKGDPFKPWSHPYDARDVADSLDVIIVLPGDYTISGTGEGGQYEADGNGTAGSIFRDGLTYYFYGGATLRMFGSGNQEMFHNDSGAEFESFVLGSGSFITEGTSQRMADIRNVNATLRVEADYLRWTGTDNIFLHSGWKSVIWDIRKVDAVAHIWGGSVARNMQQSYLRVHVDEYSEIGATDVDDFAGGIWDSVYIHFSFDEFYSAPAHNFYYTDVEFEDMTNVNIHLDFGNAEFNHTGPEVFRFAIRPDPVDCRFRVHADFMEIKAPLIRYGNTVGWDSLSYIEVTGNYRFTSSASDDFLFDMSSDGISDDGHFLRVDADIIVTDPNAGGVIRMTNNGNARYELSGYWQRPTSAGDLITVRQSTSPSNPDVLLTNLTLRNNGTGNIIDSPVAINMHTAGLKYEPNATIDADVTLIDYLPAAGGGGSGENIYNTSDTLTGPRVVEMLANNMQFQTSGTGNFEVGDLLGNNNGFELFMNPSSGLFDVGDRNSFNNGLFLSIDDNNGTITLGDLFGNSTGMYYDYNGALRRIRIGDVGGINNATELVIEDDASPIINAQVGNGIGYLGDANFEGSSRTWLQVNTNSATGSILLQTLGATSIGDQQGFGNNTYLYVYDVGQYATFNGLDVGIKVFNPTAELDVNGKARIRDADIDTFNIFTPVHRDTLGNLVDAPEQDSMIYFVSPEGVDSLARPNSAMYPYRTPWSARSAAPIGATVYVARGKYTMGTDWTGGSNLSGKQLTYHFAAGAECYFNTGSFWDLEQNPSTGGTKIMGKGRFIRNAGQTGRFFSSGSGAPAGNKAYLEAQYIEMGGASSSGDALFFLREDYDIELHVDSIVMTGQQQVLSMSGSTPAFDNRFVFHVGYFSMDQTITTPRGYFQLQQNNSEIDIHIGELYFTFASAPSSNMFSLDPGASSLVTSSVVRIQVDKAVFTSNADGSLIFLNDNSSGSGNEYDFILGDILGSSDAVILKGGGSSTSGSGTTVRIHGEHVVSTSSTAPLLFESMTSGDHAAEYFVSGRWENTAGNVIDIDNRMEMELTGHLITGAAGDIINFINSGSGDILLYDLTATGVSGDFISAANAVTVGFAGVRATSGMTIDADVTKSSYTSHD